MEDGALADQIRAASTLFSLREDAPPSVVGLRRRAETDRGRVDAALRSAGYYDARVSVEVDASVEPARAVIEVAQGERYRFGGLEILGTDGSPLAGYEADRQALGLAAGEPAVARAVVGAEGRIVSELAGQGYAFAQVTGRNVVVDHSDRTMDITFTVERGPLVRLGEPVIEGLEQVERSLVANRLDWEPGTRYDPALLERSRKRIAALAPFSNARVQLAEQPGPDGVTPVRVEVTERPRRVIGASVAYSTTEGLGLEAYWGHRNLFGGGEELRLSGFVSDIGADSFSTDVADETNFGTALEFRKPDFLSVDQTLAADLAVLSENLEAYDRRAVTSALRLERRISEQFVVGYGIAVERSRITEAERTTNNTLFGVPLSLGWNGTDDILDPTEGARVDLLSTPWTELGGDGARFIVNRATVSAYGDILGDGALVLAGRLSVGSIAGAEVEEIPADKRFYAGGGGSIRGYGYQKVGPQDAFGDPRGGRSLLEASIELRYKVTDTIGIVPFVDAGNVYDTALPNFDGDLKWGAGLGLRYYTGFGPLRADVAVPLNREPGDDAWALYLSIGQAF